MNKKHVEGGITMLSVDSLILFAKILLLAAACVGIVWLGYWYEDHVS